MKTAEEFATDWRPTSEGAIISMLEARDAEHEAALVQSRAECERLRAQLGRAVEWVATVFSDEEADKCREYASNGAAPSQPEPVKAHAFIKGWMGGGVWRCAFAACGMPENDPIHVAAPSQPEPATSATENAGTPCPACKGLKGFDEHGNPSADHVGRYCGICAGTGRAT